jgi:hypothetical protein
MATHSQGQTRQSTQQPASPCARKASMLFSFYVMSFEEPCYAALLDLMASIVHTGYSQRFQHMNTWDHSVTSAIVMSL